MREQPKDWQEDVAYHEYAHAQYMHRINNLWATGRHELWPTLSLKEWRKTNDRD